MQDIRDELNPNALLYSEECCIPPNRWVWPLIYKHFNSAVNYHELQSHSNIFPLDMNIFYMGVSSSTTQ